MSHCGIDDLLEYELLSRTVLESRRPPIRNLQAEFLERIPRLPLPFHCQTVRFSNALETASHGKMPLLPPKRTSAGFYLALQPPVSAPDAAWNTAGKWVAPAKDASGDAWVTWAETQRATLLGELLSHGNWFSRPPRREILDPLFTPWIARTMSGERVFSCKLPDIPGPTGVGGTAVWQLEGLLMTTTSIDPVWTLLEVRPDEDLDQISLFGDVDTVDGDEEDSGDETLFKRVSVGPPTDGVSAIAAAVAGTDEDTREINLDDIAAAPPDSETFRIRSREWETRKFLAKERVREARLKAQIATRLADREETRFYTHFGELDDNESRFSDYDLSDTEDGGGGGAVAVGCLDDGDGWEEDVEFASRRPAPRSAGAASTIQHV